MMKSKEGKVTKETDFIFFAPEIKQSHKLPEQESTHCIKVLRMSEGETITVTDGLGFFYKCTIIQAHPKHVVINIDETIPTPKSWSFNVNIAFAPTKNMDKNEWFVEKATEIGIDRITPLHCKFSERKEIRNDRLQKTAISAMKQSKQAVLPLIDEMTSFNEFIVQPFDGEKYIAHCYESEKMYLTSIYKNMQNALILIGPEGDFSEEEVQMAIKNNFKPISLGNNRLRTETACLVACHTIHILNSI